MQLHAYTVTACYPYILQCYVLHRAVFANISKQAPILITSIIGQKRDSMVATVECAFIWVGSAVFSTCKGTI